MSRKQSSVFQRLFKTKLLWFSPGLFRTNEMAAESDVRKMPTVVITGLPRSIAKRGPLKKKEASLLTFSITSLIKVLASYLSSEKGNLSWLKPEINQAKKTFCAHHTQPSFCPCERTWAPRTGSQFLPGLQVSKGEQQTIDLHISSVHGGDMVHTTSDKQISRTFQAFFKDKLQFLGLRFF